MAFKGVCVLVGVLLLVNCSFQELQQKKKMVKKEPTKDSAIEALQKQINNIILEVNILKEHQALHTVCLKGTKIHRKCYLPDPLPKTFSTASEDCNAMGGVLSTPTSSDESDQLRDYIRQSIGRDEEIWLGINNMATEGTWVDHTGHSIPYTNWDTSDSLSPQPEGGKSQNCAVLSGASQGKWFSENCGEKKPSVCQFNIV
ncbi:tetranectin-like [Anabas testudineus]|uniref:C-type lectin domain-containing protein n=1 Tax=Anabas testudineus TaxID=64144 RepID=A0A3Q1HW92_ANATE|nr:tetranectin-like [Anabas testudineus]